MVWAVGGWAGQPQEEMTRVERPISQSPRTAMHILKMTFLTGGLPVSTRLDALTMTHDIPNTLRSSLSRKLLLVPTFVSYIDPRGSPPNIYKGGWGKDFSSR